MSKTPPPVPQKTEKSSLYPPSSLDSWKMFDQIAPRYDRVNRILSGRMDQRWRKKLASFLPSDRPLHILDLATGTADQLIALFEKKIPVESAIGLDLSEKMMDQAQKKLSSLPFRDKIRLMQADAEQIPFPDQTFDAACFSFGIRNVPDPKRSLQEIYRVLRPEGKCLILEFSLPAHPWKIPYLFYLRWILPFLGGLFSRHYRAYRYLNVTIEHFPSGASFRLWMEEAGFSSVQVHTMALGAVSLYIGEKR